jgi:fatty acid desaturase 2 (delta-6 desaturase)
MATASASNVLRLPGEGLATGLEQLEWAEVQKHNTRESSWLVINDQVYDITNFGRRHPGGKVIYHYAGQDATDSFRALHPDSALVMKYLKPLLIGQVAPGSSTAASIVDGARPAPSAFVEEFRQVRKEFEEQGLFEASWSFFFGMLAHIFLLEAAAYYSIKLLGNSWPVYLLAVGLLATAQAQAGWLQVRPPNPCDRSITLHNYLCIYVFILILRIHYYHFSLFFKYLICPFLVARAHR